MVTVIGYLSTLFGTTFAFFTTAKMAAFAASNSWPPPSQFLLYVMVNFIVSVLDSDDDADDALLEKELLPLLAKGWWS
jgi:hypothetical protein